MNYTLDMIDNELSRLEKKLEDEKSALKASLEYVERHELTIRRYEASIEELKAAATKLGEN